MSYQAIRTAVWDQVRQRDLRAFGAILTDELLHAALLAAGVPVGRGPLHRINLIWLALASALHTGETFKTVLNQTIERLDDSPHADRYAPSRARQALLAPADRKRHDPRPSDPATISEEAFTQARQLLPWGVWIALILLLTARFEEQHAPRVRYKRFRLLSLDGTCLSLPHWKALKSWFGTASNGKGPRRTQARLVMLQLPLVRMPWRYELAPIRHAEKTIAPRLLDHLRPDDLVLMDRGFFGYGLFCQIAGRQAYFAIRAVKNVKLVPVETLTDGSRLVDWTPANPQWRRQGLSATMRLRVIDYQFAGFRPSQLLTNVLDAAAISRPEWVGMVRVDATGRVLQGAGLYHRRWEIETTYFELKETQGLEQSLRSRTPEGIVYEVGGHILLYLLMRWLMVQVAEAQGDDPLRLSYSGAFAEVKTMGPALVLASGRRAAAVLLPRLWRRIAGHEVPLRPGRHYPRPNDTKAKNKGKGCKQPSSKLAPGESAAGNYPKTPSNP